MRTLFISSALATTALLGAPAGAQTGTGEFCLKTMAGEARCEYRSMAQCTQALPPASKDQCVARSHVSGTTGSGVATPPANPSGQSANPQPERQIPPPAPPQ